MSKPKITACVIAFNEERDIAECLASLTWCDEVIVVDFGSTDRTVAIAQDFGARIIVRPFEGFSAQKNFAADQARNDWILSVDADEILTPELRDELATTVASTSASGFYIPRLNLWLNQPIRHAGWYPDYTLRLYRRSAGKWVGHSHERVVVDGDTRILRSPIVHKTIATMHDHLRKGLLSSVLELKEAKANGLRFYWFPPGSVLKQIINDVKKGPFSLLTFRMAYKQHLKNRVDFVWLLPFHPFLRFLYMYVVRLGFLDGTKGFWLAYTSAVVEAMKRLKIWEHYRYRACKVTADAEQLENPATLYRSIN